MEPTFTLYRIQLTVFKRHRHLTFALAISIYALVIIVFGRQLRISANYLVALPVITAALGYGFWGGFSVGMFGLPMNLLLFTLIGHPEYAPESTLFAELFGMFIGGSMGALSTYFHALTEEVAKSRRITDALHERVQDKEILIQEVHHRVKNNLTLILSLLQLQRNQADSQDFVLAMEMVSTRIRAIASVHDHIYTHETNTSVNLQHHIPELCRAIVESHNRENLTFTSDVQFKSGLSVDKATPLSLIVLEILTNSCKHAFSPDQADPRIFLYGRETDEEIILILSDNGGVTAESGEGGLPLSEPWSPGKRGLGSTIIKALARQLRAEIIINTNKGYEYVVKIKKLGASPAEQET